MRSFISLLFLVCVTLALGFNPEENRNEDDTTLFEGDMIVTQAEKRAALRGNIAGSARAAIYNRKWTNAIVYYEIRDDLKGTSAEGIIASAMKEWESKTCVRFQKRTTQTNYVYFYKGTGCSSYVGMYGNGQPISLASGCWYHGIVAHEIGHALGFYHEQSRPDRDNYVTIQTANIKEDAKFNFAKYDRNRINTMNTPYDYGSLMHYGAYDFSKNGGATIVAKISGVTFGQRDYVSDLDAHQMSLRYNCPAYTVDYGCSYKAAAVGWRCWKYCGIRGSGNWCWVNKSCSYKPNCGSNADMMKALCYGKCG